MSQKRFMKMFSFWLNLNDEDQYRLAETIDVLKESRLFSKGIRDGLRIMAGLLMGDVTPLVELYPWVVDSIIANYGQPVAMRPDPPKASSDDNGLKQDIARLEQLILSQSANQIPTQTMQPIASTPARSGKESPPPVIDDFELEIKQAGKDENNNSVWNLIIASALNIYGNYDGLAPEIIKYGLKTGRISASMIQNKVPLKASGNPKSIVVPEFDAPEFELDDIELAITDRG